MVDLSGLLSHYPPGGSSSDETLRGIRRMPSVFYEGIAVPPRASRAGETRVGRFPVEPSRLPSSLAGRIFLTVVIALLVVMAVLIM